jgi:hypothetical protein
LTHLDKKEKMLTLIQYFFAIAFLFLTIYFGIKGLLVGIGDIQDVQSHKKRAIFYTMSTFCGLVSFEFYYPTITALICLPGLLISIWVEYLLARSFRLRK